MKALNLFSLFISGISIGWLVGLSVTPIIQNVIGTILTIITSILTFLYSIQESQITEKIKDKLGVINTLPLALFLIGLSFSTTIGIYARTNDWLGINPEYFRNKWQIKNKDSSGIINNLYNRIQNNRENGLDKSAQGVLFSSNTDCVELLKIDDIEALISELQSKSPEWQYFTDSVQANFPKSEQLLILRNKIIKHCR